MCRAGHAYSTRCRTENLSVVCNDIDRLDVSLPRPGEQGEEVLKPIKTIFIYSGKNRRVITKIDYYICEWKDNSDRISGVQLSQ